jgi:colicin import membrane protein
VKEESTMTTRTNLALAAALAIFGAGALQPRTAEAASIEQMIREAREAKAKEEAADEAKRKAEGGKSMKDLIEEARKSQEEKSKALRESMKTSTSIDLKKESDMEKAIREKLEASKPKPPKDLLQEAKDKVQEWKDKLFKKPEKERTLLDDFKEQEAKKGKSVEQLMKEAKEGSGPAKPEEKEESLEEKMKRMLKK